MFSQPAPQLALVTNFVPQPRPEPLRVIVVGGDPLARIGLVSIVSEADDVDVEAIAPTERLAARLRFLAPDVVLCDLGGSGEGSTELLDSLREAGFPVVVLARDRNAAADALASGARGILLRDASTRRLAAALRAAAEGLTTIDEGLTETFLLSRRAEALEDPLTTRELEVMQHLASGLANKEIAQRLGITDHTVKFHVNAILGKLGAESRTEAVVHAAKLGIVVL